MLGLRNRLKAARERRRLRREIGCAVLDSVRQLSVVAFPNRLHEGYALGKCLHLLGVQTKQFDSWSKPDLVIHWQDLTENVIDACSYISLFGSQVSDGKIPCGINYFCNDISKASVGKAHHSAFGYPLDVDPTTYCGPMVEKSDANATHDGRVVNGPLLARDVQVGKVYSVLVDNTNEGLAIDCRLVFLGGSVLPLYYEKRRPVAGRFSNTNTSVTLRDTEVDFTEKEIESIKQVCRSLKADYGEMDVLRDAKSGRVYVVDFAKTPVGPPNGLSDKHAREAIFAMSKAIALNLLLPITKQSR